MRIMFFITNTFAYVVTIDLTWYTILYERIVRGWCFPSVASLVGGLSLDQLEVSFLLYPTINALDACSQSTSYYIYMPQVFPLMIGYISH